MNQKKFDSPRESQSFCDFWFTSATQKFANKNESIQSEPWVNLESRISEIILSFD